MIRNLKKRGEKKKNRPRQRTTAKKLIMIVSTILNKFSSTIKKSHVRIQKMFVQEGDKLKANGWKNSKKLATNAVLSNERKYDQKKNSTVQKTALKIKQD